MSRETTWYICCGAKENVLVVNEATFIPLHFISCSMNSCMPVSKIALTFPCVVAVRFVNTKVHYYI